MTFQNYLDKTDTPVELIEDINLVKHEAQTKTIVMVCKCGLEQPITNTICPACGGDVS